MAHYLGRHQRLCLLCWASSRLGLDDLKGPEKSRQSLCLHFQSYQNLYRRHLWT